MGTSKQTIIFLVDDDEIFLKVLETQFKERTPYTIKTFLSGEECVKNLSQGPEIIFLDYYLNGADPKADTGLAVLDKIKAFDPEIQVVMLSSLDSIEVAINCMKHKAFDYIVKGEVAFIRAQKAITFIFHQKKLQKEVVSYKAAIIISITFVVLVIVSVILLQTYFPKLM